MYAGAARPRSWQFDQQKKCRVTVAQCRPGACQPRLNTNTKDLIVNPRLAQPRSTPSTENVAQENGGPPSPAQPSPAQPSLAGRVIINIGVDWSRSAGTRHIAAPTQPTTKKPRPDHAPLSALLLRRVETCTIEFEVVAVAVAGS